MRLNEYLEVVVEGYKKVTKCLNCDYVLGPASENPKELAVVKKFPITRSGPLCNPWEDRKDIETREFYCPGCGSMFAVEVINLDENYYRETTRILSEFEV